VTKWQSQRKTGIIHEAYAGREKEKENEKRIK
jgi:hypothetical protein